MQSPYFVPCMVLKTGHSRVSYPEGVLLGAGGHGPCSTCNVLVAWFFHLLTGVRSLRATVIFSFLGCPSSLGSSTKAWN